MSTQKTAKNNPAEYNFWCQQMLNYCLMIGNFDNWSDEFFRSDVKEMAAKLVSKIKENIDFKTLTLESAKQMGVRLFDSDEGVTETIESIKRLIERYGKEDSFYDPELLKNTRNLWLLPPTLLMALPDDVEVTSISGETYLIKDITDLEMRGGCTAYGLHTDAFYTPE